MIFVYNFFYGSDFLYLVFLALYKTELENAYLCKQFYSPYSHLLYGLLENASIKSSIITIVFIINPRITSAISGA